jgi:1-aminocyclopropane-1-carboxylate deaminase
MHEYHFGGFAKTTPELLSFKKDFEKQYGFELDYVYTSKMFYGIFDLIKKNYFKEGSTIITVHTGGLQGNKGFN